MLLFSDIPAFAYLKNSANYADSFSDDDHWKLEHIFGYRPPIPHPLLGWIGSSFSRDNYLHHEFEQVGERRPVLLYGESFARCSPEAICFQDIKKTLNKKIILEITKELKAKNIDFVFLILHPHWPGISTLDRESDWRDPFVKQLLQENEIPFIWSKELYRQDTQGQESMLGDSHPTSYFNGLIAEEIKRYALDNP